MLRARMIVWPPPILWIKCMNQGSQSPNLFGSLRLHFMEGSVTWHNPIVAGSAPRGLWSQPVLSRVNILWKGLTQQPQGRLGSPRVYMKNRHFHTLCLSAITYMTSLVPQTVKNLPAMQETRVWSLAGKDPLKKGMVTHSSILAWRIPWTEEPGSLKSMRSRRVEYKWVTNTFLHMCLAELSLRLACIRTSYSGVEMWGGGYTWKLKIFMQTSQPFCVAKWAEGQFAIQMLSWQYSSQN